MKLQGQGLLIVEGRELLAPEKQKKQKWLDRLIRYCFFPFELCQFAVDFYTLDYIGMAEWAAIGGVTVFFYIKGQKDKPPFIKIDEEKFSYQFAVLDRVKKFYFSEIKSVHFELENIVFYLKNGKHEVFMMNQINHKDKLELIRECLVEQLKINNIQMTLSSKNMRSFYEKYPELEGTLEIFDRYLKI